MSFCVSTCPQAGERQRELAHKVIFGGVVVVLHHEPDQGQLRDLKLEAQGAVPPWVKTCRGRKSAKYTLNISGLIMNRRKMTLNAAICCLLI